MTSPDISLLVDATLRSVSAEENGWHFVFSDGSSLRIECPWRLIANGRIAITSDDHSQRFGLAEPLDAASVVVATIASRPIRDALIAHETGDLVVHFGLAARVEVLVNSAGYESWCLALADGRTLTARGGGEVALSRGAV